MVSSIFINQSAFQNIPAIVADRIKENVIYRSLYQHILSHSCHFADDTGKGRNHTSTEYQAFRSDSQVMSSLPPSTVRLSPVIRNDRISENSLFRPFLDGVCNRWNRLEIHVCYPHGQFVVLNIPFHRIRIPPII